MGVLPIANQPIDLDNTEADACNTGDGKNYCALYNTSDKIYAQWKVEPCGDDLCCAPFFATDGADTSCWLNNVPWNIGTSACIEGDLTGETLELEFTPPVSTAGYYKLSIRISGFESGILKIYDDSAIFLKDITGNGIHTIYVYNTGGHFYFTSAIDSDGLYLKACIDEVHLYEIEYADTFLTDIDGNIIGDIINYGNSVFFEDRIIMELNADSIGVGCYRLAVEDLCDPDTLSGMVEINGDVGFDTPGSWALELAHTSASHTIASSKYTLTHSGAGSGTSYIERPYVWLANQYIVTVIVETGSVTSNAPTRGIVFNRPINDPGDAVIQIATGIVSNTTYTKTFILSKVDVNPLTWNPNPNVWIANNLHDNLILGLKTSGGSSGIIELKSYSVRIKELNTNTTPWLSNCFSIKTEHDCAKLVEGYETPAVEQTSYANGFVFHNNPLVFPSTFKLTQRLRVLKFNPHYPTDTEDYQPSDSSRKLVSSRREKYYDILFDYMDESALDALTAEVLCNHFYIDGVEYFVKPEDFKPEWDKDGRQRLAQVRMIARKKTGTIYNRIQ